MRIISGKYKGRTIKMPKGIRPTQNKVRKALFDILGEINGLSFLELFAGSGAVGFEALSQGAKEVVFVEKDRKCIEKIEENLSVLAFSPACRPGRRSRVLALDALVAIKQLGESGEKLDIIFLDPPYYKRKVPRHYVSRSSLGDSGSKVAVMGESLSKKTLQTLGAYDILAPNGFIVVQHFKKDKLPGESGQLVLVKEARYGDTLLSFYRKK
jgi:16S rRNA (guanine(966)-N(2))-methyltransferase RsmD